MPMIVSCSQCGQSLPDDAQGELCTKCTAKFAVQLVNLGEASTLDNQIMDGQSIAHYRIIGKLGEGGMGEVYRARDTRLDGEVAIKVLPPEIADGPQRRMRFLREAKAASALNHPNVCTIYEVSETDEGEPFIAMEYLRGQTLASLARQKPLESEQVVNIGIQIADALDAAHQAGMIHTFIAPHKVSAKSGMGGSEERASEV